MVHLQIVQEHPSCVFQLLVAQLFLGLWLYQSSLSFCLLMAVSLCFHLFSSFFCLVCICEELGIEPRAF